MRWHLAFATLFGVIAQRTKFCLQGALRDHVNLQQSQRLVTFLAAMAFAALASSVVESMALVSLDSTKPSYRSSEFAWGRYIIGGFIFGYGMVLSAGCGFRQLIKSGEGNYKAMWVLTVMALTIYWLTRGEFFAAQLLPLFAPLTLSLDGAQDIGSLISAEHGQNVRLAVAALLSGIAIWQLRARRASVGTWISAVVIGTLIALGFVLTGGEYAQFLADEAEFMSTPPSGLGGQSFTTTAPLGDVVYFLDQRSFAQLTFGVLAVTGLVLGSILSAAISRKFNWVGFDSLSDFIRANIGAVMAGIGSVIALGCSVGHGLTGFATLSVGSLVAVAAIVAGGRLAVAHSK